MSWKVTTQVNQKKNQGYGKKSQSCQHKQGERTHAPFELTSLPHRRNRASHVKHATEQEKKRPSEGKRAKCEEQKHVNLLCPKESELLRCLLWDCSFNSSLLDPDVIHQRWQIWHDSCLGSCGEYRQKNYLQHSVCVWRGEVCQNTTRYSDLPIFLCAVLKVPPKRVEGLKHVTWTIKCLVYSECLVFAILQTLKFEWLLGKKR